MLLSFSFCCYYGDGGKNFLTVKMAKFFPRSNFFFNKCFTRALLLMLPWWGGREKGELFLPFFNGKQKRKNLLVCLTSSSQKSANFARFWWSHRILSNRVQFNKNSNKKTLQIRDSISIGERGHSGLKSEKNSI